MLHRYLERYVAFYSQVSYDVMMSLNSENKIALVHDELIRRGGAEIVFEKMLSIFPEADVYSLYSGNGKTITVNGGRFDINTSSLQKWPLWFRKHPGRMLPFLASAAEQFDLSEYDVVISSASDNFNI